MGCEDLDLLIEELAAGASSAPEAAAHLRSCARCQARVRLARAIERSLESRERPEPPLRFTTAVLARVRRERWRVEQVVDLAFNVAIAAGVLLVLAGVAALAWSLDWYSLSPAVVQVARDLSARWLVRVQEQLVMIGIAVAILSSALVLWRWVEGGRLEL